MKSKFNKSDLVKLTCTAVAPVSSASLMAHPGAANHPPVSGPVHGMRHSVGYLPGVVLLVLAAATVFFTVRLVRNGRRNPAGPCQRTELE